MYENLKISVAMCTFNGEAFLKEQLESILAQTVLPTELVVCDDCSKDGSLEILYEFKESCNFPVIVIANAENFGINKNFENAIAHCSGELIALADQDDIWQPYKLETIYKIFQDNPQCGYVFSNADLIDANGKSLCRDLWQSIGFTHKRYSRYAAGDQLEVMLSNGNFIYGMTMAFRSVYKPTLLPIESQSYACTHDTWISTILSSIGANGVAVSKCLVKYRQHPNQLSGGGRQFKFFQLLERARIKKSEIDMTFINALMNIQARLRLENQNKEIVLCSVKKLTEKVEHIRARYLASVTKGLTKFKIVFRESITGRYGKYSGSIKSILKDLFLNSQRLIKPHMLHDTNFAKTPNFFVVGAAKAGTSSLENYLRKHPEIYISPIKEPHFFSEDINPTDFRSNFRKRSSLNIKKYLSNYPLPPKHVAYIEDLPIYLELFREVKNEKAIGELSTGYLYSKCAAEKIYKFNPDAKIIILLRQPVFRAFSHYLMNIRDMWDYQRDFINSVECDLTHVNKGWGKSHLYVELGLYFEQVSRYLKRFPESQVKISLYDDLEEDPVKFMEELFEFLEVDSSKLSLQDFFIKHNSSKLPLIKILSWYLPVFDVLREYIFIFMPYKVKAQIKKIIFSSKEVPNLRKDEFEQVMKYFSEDIQKLSVLIKRDLQSWHYFEK